MHYKVSVLSISVNQNLVIKLDSHKMKNRQLVTICETLFSLCDIRALWQMPGHNQFSSRAFRYLTWDFLFLTVLSIIPLTFSIFCNQHFGGNTEKIHQCNTTYSKITLLHLFRQLYKYGWLAILPVIPIRVPTAYLWWKKGTDLILDYCHCFDVEGSWVLYRMP